MAYNQAMALLSSKLTPPHMGAALHRDRLLGPAFNHGSPPGTGASGTNVPGAPPSPVRLVQIIAGAGFGKTTLAAQWVSRGKDPAAWYRLDEFDRDFSVFAAYLTRAVETAAPKVDFNFPLPPDPAMAKAGRFDWLITWLAALEQGLPLTLVLDDYHLVDTHLNGVVEFLLDRLPQASCIFLVSRREPDLKISRLRAGMAVVDIRERELAFTPEETLGFFASRSPAPPPSPKEITRIQKKTHGWAAGLALFSCALASDEDGWTRTAALDQLPDSPGAVFAYLEENIFDQLSMEDREFMVKTAQLSSMETDFCNAVLDIGDAEIRFRRMARSHLMVFPLTGKTPGFYYHHLLREFLLARAPEVLGKERIRRLHYRAADILAPRAHPLALHHYIQARAYDRAAELLTTLETQLLLMGQMPFVKSCLDKIPEGIKNTHPQLLFMAAKQASYYGNPHRAIDLLKAAGDGFRQRGDSHAAAKCLADLGAQYYYIGCIPRARQLLEQALEQTPAEAPTFILIMTYLIFLTAVLGDITASRAHEKRARREVSAYPAFLQRAAQVLINTSVTHREYIRGDFRASARRNRDLIRSIQGMDLPACMPLARYQSAATAFVLGRHDQGIAHAEAGLATAARIHLRDSQKGWLFLAWAENSMGKQQWEEARDKAQRGMDIFQGQDNHWGQAYGYTLMAGILLGQGRLHRALDQTQAAMDHLRDRGLAFQAGTMGLTRVRILMALGRYPKALDCLGQHLPRLAPAPHYTGLAQVLALQCRLALGKIAPEPAQKQMEEILGRGREPGWDAWARERLCPGITAPTAPPSLDITLLGPFRLRVGDRSLLPALWTHGNALALFKYLAAHQDQGFLPKDLLLEILWPGQDPDKTGKRFNVAVSRLRKILEPDLPPKAPSRYIQRNRDQYRLDMGPWGRCDLGEFRAHSAAARTCKDAHRAKDHALKAVAAYGGPFLEDTRDRDWSLRLQEELAREYGRILKQLIRFHQAHGPDDQTRRWLGTYLELDPFEEPFYPPLMTLLADQGRYDRVRYWFDRCATAMAEMDCPISPETQDCFKDLMARRPAPDIS